MTEFSTEQNLPFTFKVVDGRGRVVKVDGTPKAASSDETVATVELYPELPDGTWSGLVSSVAPSPEGTTQRVTVEADADLGEGVQSVIGVLEFNVTLDEASKQRIINIEAGAPVDKPA
jgi:hypothetical protein